MTRPSALAVYVHWPYCARICPYCDFNVVRARGREAEADRLLAAIRGDLAAQARLAGPRRLASVFFGGGTPSLMRPEAVESIISTARRLWPPDAEPEVTLEANPTSAETRRFADYRAAGVTRLSLGLQSLNDDALRFLGRDHTATEALRAAEAALSAFARVSLDAIYARPGQDVAAWRSELSEIAALGAEHISPYQLTIEAGTAFDRAARRGTLIPPGDDLAARLYAETQEVLEGAGYDAYEVSNHAKGPTARSVHNLAYWTGVDYLGVGPGAHGRITTQGGRLATFAAPRPTDYIARVVEGGDGLVECEALSAADVAEERLLSGLRVTEGVAFGEIAALDLSPDHGEVRRLTDLGFLVPDRARLRATPAGRRVLNALTSTLILSD